MCFTVLSKKERKKGKAVEGRGTVGYIKKNFQKFLFYES